ncbi:MAG: ACP S-malonyltransferase [Calditrichaeota bacterium]|nr:ACP S-malonyltransferase [Calditrichota bacterium]
MGRDLYENSPAAAAFLDRVIEFDGMDHIRELCFEGPAELLTRTDNVQPAITAISLMVLEAIREATDITPIACAGHSLGEYAAHVAAGSFSAEVAMNLVRWRGFWMNQASQPPNPPGAMVAVMGLGAGALKGIVAEIGTDKLAVANINSPGQIIISGTKDAVEQVESTAKEAGAKRCVMLNVSGAWHSPLMVPAEAKMKGLLEEVITPEQTSISESVKVVANATSDVVHDLDSLRHTLTRQITSPVRWDACVKRLLGLAGYPDFPSQLSEDIREELGNPPVFVEIGPGKVLKGLLRSNDRKLKAVNVEDVAGVKALKDMVEVN